MASVINFLRDTNNNIGAAYVDTERNFFATVQQIPIDISRNISHTLEYGLSSTASTVDSALDNFFTTTSYTVFTLANTIQVISIIVIGGVAVMVVVAGPKVLKYLTK